MPASLRDRTERAYYALLDAMARRRALWMTLIVGAVAASGVFLTRLHFDTSFTTLLPEDHPQMVAETRSLRTFGALVPIVVVVEDPALWTEAGVARVRALTRALADVEHVERVLSITSVAKIRADAEGIRVERFVGDEAVTPERARALRAEALGDALIRGDIVSRDGDETAILVEIEYVEGKDDVVAMEGAQGVWRVLEREGYFDGDRAPRGPTRLFVAGAPVIAEDLQRLMQKDSFVLSVAPLALLLGVLALTFRSARGVVLPLAVVALTVVAAFAFKGAVGWGVSIVSLNLPPLLMVIALADAIHLLSAYEEERAGGAAGLEAARRGAWAVFIPCLMTSITTADGFASLLVSSLLPVQRMGIVAGVGIFAAFTLTFTLLPLALARGGTTSAARARAFETGTMRRFLDATLAVSLRHPGKIFFASAALALAGVAAIPQVRVETSFRETLPDDSPVLADLSRVERDFAGVDTFKVYLEAPEGSDFVEPAHMRRLAAISDFVAAQPEVDKVYSAAEILREMNRLLHGGDPEQAVVPETREAIAQNLFVFGLAGATELERVITEDRERALILARVRSGSTIEYQALVERVRGWLAAGPDGDVRATPGGAVTIVADLIHELVVSQLESFGLAFVVIVLTMGVLLRDLRLTLVSIVPNLFPILTVGAVMAAGDIPLDINTIMVASIMIGVAVDDTIHYLWRFKREFADCGDYREAVARTTHSVGRAVVATSVLLMVGFGSSLLSSFKPPIYFAVLSLSTIGIALAAELFVTPALLVTLRPLGPERRG